MNHAQSEKLEGLEVIIPALNEEATIGAVVERLAPLVGRVVVVDDGSRDATSERARAAGAEVISNPGPHGYDAAIAFGLNHAFSRGATACVTCDADGQHRSEDVVAVSIPVLREGFELSAGIRDHYNRWIELAVGAVSRFVLQNSDPFCGLKCYSRRIFELSGGKITSSLNIGTLFLAWAKVYGLRMRLVPIKVLPRADHSRFGDMLRASRKLTVSFVQTLRELGALRKGSER